MENILWTKTECLLGLVGGSLWAALNFLLGGIDTPIKALAILMILDFITGVYAGYKLKILDSAKGSKGIFKKVGVFCCIAVACVLDMAMSFDMFRGMVISGFAVIEALSLIENVDRMGYGYVIPEFIREKLKQISETKYGNERRG